VAASTFTPANPRHVSLRKAAAIRKWLARNGGAVVLTNGVFDLLHPGRSSCLEAARRFIREIAAPKPDVYCKAADYTLDKAGSRIVRLPFLRGFSTTRLIRRIKAAGSV